ncbi:MAG: chromosomal replication initiator protein DnaA [Bacteroidota bacterium]|nr:chromosomal replication initiator protein DnaA [Bacteroidota bacterium]
MNTFLDTETPENAGVLTENFNGQSADVWTKCLSIIGEKVNLQSFNAWFEPIKPLSVDGKILTLQVPSNFFHEWIEDRYSDLLSEVIKNVLGNSGKINFLVNSEMSEADRGKTLWDEADKSLPNNFNDQKKDYLYPSHFTSKEKTYHKPVNSALNPKNTFDNYIKGESNQLARAAAYAVANNPGGTQFNPLVIYGDVGLGKTHLIQSIGNHALQNGKAKRVMYVTSEVFTLEFVDSIQTDKVNNFSNFYRSMDILIVDDIQFFEGKDKTQDHFFHTFNTLYQSGKQIVLSSDRPPKELKGLNDRLISRFQSGLTADIQSPDLEMRTAILRKKSEDNGIELRQDVIEFIAANVTSNIRELEGCLISLLAHSSIRSREIDIDLAKDVVRSIIGEIKSHITIEDIQRIVCDYFNIPENFIRAKNRKQEIVLARQLAMYLSKEITNSSLKTIGLHFGGRDHSTVIHAIQTIEDLVKYDKKYSDMLPQLRSKIKIGSRV